MYDNDHGWIESKKLSSKEQNELIAKAQFGDIEARNEMIVNNIPFLRMMVHKLQSRGYFYRPNFLSFDDLVHSGVFGLIRAIEKFDLSLDAKFSVYAQYWIIHFVQNAIRCSKLRKIPDWISSNKKKLSKASAKTKKGLSNKLEMATDLRSDEIWDHIDYSEHHTIQVEKKDEIQVLRRNIQSLEHTEKVVILERLKNKTLQEIGSQLGKGRETIRNIEVRATNKLRNLMIA
jgi:RNA polymerase sporulation-specific sigma factor